MHKTLGAAVVLLSLAAPAHAAEPFLAKRLACDEIRLIWISDDVLGRGPASVVTVRNEGGNSGVQIYVDRASARTAAVRVWREAAGGASSVTTLPGNPRIDYVDCQDADPLGGIVVEYFEARDFLP